MTFTRLGKGDLLALVAALALLLVMALDWYSTDTGEQLRRDSKSISPQLDREISPSLTEQATTAAEEEEKNAWQADAAIDRLLLLVLLATVALALVAAFMRAADRRRGPPSPSALASVAALLAFALIVYRIVQPPGLNEGAVIKAGAPLGLLFAALVLVGSRIATIGERDAAESARRAGREAAGGPGDAATAPAEPPPATT